MNEESTIIEKLDYLEGTKTSIKNAIISKGQEVTENDTFRSYAQKIAAIETGIDTSDATATAEDIKAGKTAYVDGEKIEGTHVDEDLTSVLNAQDQKIAELEAALENKTAGGKTKLNIYAQTTEPTEKDGIWLETDKTFNKVYFDEQVKKITVEGWDVSKSYPHIDVSSSAKFPVAGVGNYLYIFLNNKIYKYDIFNQTLEIQKNININGGYAACTIDDNIYVINDRYIYRYNIINDEFILLYTGSNSFQSSSMVAVGTDIYIMGCRYYGSTYEGIFKYDTINNTGSVYSITLPGWMNANYMNIPCVVGNLIYIFGNESNNKSYVIDTLNTTITQIADLPRSGSVSITTCNVGNYIYIITTTQNTIYKYNIINDTYTVVNPLNKPAYSESNYIYAPNDDVIVFISKSSSNTSNIYNFALTYNVVYDYENNSVVVWDGFGKYKTQITQPSENQEGKIQTLFYDAYHYTAENGLDDTIPTYYGDGTQWIKFKN